MPELEKCYEKLKNIVGDNVENFQSVKIVDTYRKMFKPDKVKIILLAESHVFTKRENLVPLCFPDGIKCNQDTFVRFVYCLGYGENSLLKESVSPNSGTPQYWKIFHSCLNEIQNHAYFSGIMKWGTKDDSNRISNKLSLLMELKNRGIWLLDSSIIGLYKTGSEKTKGNIFNLVVMDSWNTYVRKIVQDESPAHTIIIGKGINNLLGEKVREIVGNNYTVVDQPQSRMSPEGGIEYYKRFYQLCKKYV